MSIGAFADEIVFREASGSHGDHRVLEWAAALRGRQSEVHVSTSMGGTS